MIKMYSSSSLPDSSSCLASRWYYGDVASPAANDHDWHHHPTGLVVHSSSSVLMIVGRRRMISTTTTPKTSSTTSRTSSSTRSMTSSIAGDVWGAFFSSWRLLLLLVLLVLASTEGALLARSSRSCYHHDCFASTATTPRKRPTGRHHDLYYPIISKRTSTSSNMVFGYGRTTIPRRTWGGTCLYEQDHYYYPQQQKKHQKKVNNMMLATKLEMTSSNQNDETDAEESSSASMSWNDNAILLHETTTATTKEIHVVLFGIGDLRIDDHMGFYQAIQEMNNNNNNNNSITVEKLITTAVWMNADNDSIINIPGMIAHTIDTIQLLQESIMNLQSTIWDQCNHIPLHIIMGDDDSRSSSSTRTASSVTLSSSSQEQNNRNDNKLSQFLFDLVDATVITSTAQNKNNDTPSSSSLISPMKVILHVCDLGLVDNELGYGPYSYLQSLLFENNNSISTNNFFFLDHHHHPSSHSKIPVEIRPWNCHLRQDPWEQISQLPDDYETYVTRYQSSMIQTPMNITATPLIIDTNNSYGIIHPKHMISLPQYQYIPSLEELSTHIMHVLQLDTSQCQNEKNTGLYGTHWGGLDPQSIGTSIVLDTIHTYTEQYQGNDELWSQQSRIRRSCIRNPNSLEHAAMLWQLRGDGSYPMGNIQQWLIGEGMIRYLSAPLLFGTISIRRIYALASKINTTPCGSMIGSMMANTILGPTNAISNINPLIQLVEGREWHQLLAARNMITNSNEYPSFSSLLKSSSSSLISTNQASINTLHQPVPLGRTIYKYWRYHGFLCRFGQTPLIDGFVSSSTNTDRSGALMIHGFGASGSQWNKCFAELANFQKTQQPTLSSSSQIHLDEGLAPDLLGFGQSEKPGLSYTGYLWDGMMMDFVKEVALPGNHRHGHRSHGWTNFIVGGNSIGGYTSMALAACDSAHVVPSTLNNNNNDYREVSIINSRRLLVTSNGSPGTNKCRGLVLMNSAGPIKTNEEVTMEQTAAQLGQKKLQLESVAQVTAQDALPASKFLQRPLTRLFGQALLWYLRPNIQSICTRLYPTNPSAVDEALCTNIRRDSLDLGAINVMMAGAKLPPPRTANELLGADFGGAPTPNEILVDVEESGFRGPVLVAQGVLDPLNDSRDRMQRFGALRPGITTRPILAGHCPHDELPLDVAQCILEWIHDAFGENVRSDVATSSSAISR